MRTRITITGLTQVQDYLQRLGDRAIPALSQAVHEVANNMMNESQDLVPVDTGALRASGVVREPQVRGNRVNVELGYGGSAAQYAIYVHEDMSARHPVGQSKFLETAVLNQRDGASGHIASVLRGELGL